MSVASIRNSILSAFGGSWTQAFGSGQLAKRAASAVAKAIFDEAVNSDVAGVIKQYGGSTAPDGYLECDGSAVSRDTFSDLFDAIGTTFGVGDGSTTFNLPDGRGRSFIGKGQGSGLTDRSLGDSGGEEEVTLTITEMPSHRHIIDVASHVHGVDYDGSSFAASGTALNAVTAGTSDTDATKPTATASLTGSGDPHNNMPPFLVGMWIIKT